MSHTAGRLAGLHCLGRRTRLIGMTRMTGVDTAEVAYTHPVTPGYDRQAEMVILTRRRRILRI